MNLSAPLTDPGNALEAVRYCQQCYGDTTLQTDDAHIMITELDEAILVACRGSKSPEDWVNDCCFEFSDTIYGRLHTGFWVSTNTILPSIHEALNVRPHKTIWVLGHSLGASQAEIVAVDLMLSKFPVERVMTFGGPRTGNADWKVFYERMLGAQTVRWVNGRDIVPRVPFTEMGYVQVGQEAFLPSQTKGVEVNPSVWEMAHDDVLGVVADLQHGRIQLLSNHHLEDYRDRIIKLTQ